MTRVYLEIAEVGIERIQEGMIPEARAQSLAHNKEGSPEAPFNDGR